MAENGLTNWLYCFSCFTLSCRRFPTPWKPDKTVYPVLWIHHALIDQITTKPDTFRLSSDFIRKYPLSSEVLRERRRIFGGDYPQRREIFTYIQSYFTVFASSSWIIRWNTFSVVVSTTGESVQSESLTRAFISLFRLLPVLPIASTSMAYTSGSILKVTRTFPLSKSTVAYLLVVWRKNSTFFSVF